MKNENTKNTVESTEVTITVETPASTDVQVKDAPKSTPKKQTDAAKIKTLESIAKKAGNDITVSIAPKSKKPAASKKAKVETKTEPKPEKAKVEVKAKDAKAEPEKVDLSKVAPLVIPRELLTAKMEKLSAKLEKEKLTVTRNAFHVAYGYFLARAKSGKTLMIEYHETLKPAKWLVRDDKGKVLTAEPIPTLWKAHETAINL